MAVEDIDWQEQYGDQSHKREGLRSIWVTLLALHISQAVVLPTMYELLLSMHARALMLGYCFAATCLGELCAGPVFSMWYDKRPAKEAVVAALMLNAGGSFLYAVSPNSLTVLFSRFLVGCGCGVGSVLWTMVGGFTNRDNRDEVISSMRMLRHLGFIIGVGLAAVATWQHDSPAVFGRLNRALPGLSHSASASSNVSTSGNLANLWGALGAALGVQGLEGQAVREILPLGDQIKLPAHDSEKSSPSSEENMVSALSRSAMMLRQDVWEGPADFDGFSSLRDHALEVLANGKKDAGAKGGGRDWGKNSTAGENATSSAGWDVDDKVVTDDDIEWGMGLNGKQWYIPGYITAMVGKNYLRAPGYLGVLVSFTAVFFVSATLKEGPRKYLSQHVPLAQLNPRALSCFTPLSACVGLETAAQFCAVMMEMAVPAIVGMWMAWTTDAKAIYMMGLSCLGIIGYAVLEPFRVWFPLRHLMLGSVLVLAMGIVQAVSWDGKLNIGRYTLGLSLISIATAPLSTICTQVVNKAVIKTYSEEGAMVWGQLFWSITSVPARTLGPIVFAYSLEMDESGGLGYMCLLAVALVAIGILVFFQSQLITPQVGEDAEVLPGSEPTITGDGVNMTRYAPLSP